MRPDQQTSMAFPKPGKALIGVMIALGCIWVAYACAVNFADVDPAIAYPFIGNGVTSFIQPWRFLTAALLHHPNAPWHLLTTLLGLYFLGTTLEDRWGARKMLFFLAGSAMFAFAIQAAVGAMVPRLDSPRFYGGLGMVEAVAVAWALANRHAQIRLMFVLPVSGSMLLVFVFVMSVLNVIAARAPTEGLITPFGGMLAGWLFGDYSPLRRLWLKLRLKQLQRETEAMRGAKARTRAASGLRVIPGGADRPKDKRDLN
ncbi:MAG: rhomboid family intramembrane serine protease [Polyangiaceae bacterium]